MNITTSIIYLSLLGCIAGNNSGSRFLKEAAHFSVGPFGLYCCLLLSDRSSESSVIYLFMH